MPIWPFGRLLCELWPRPDLCDQYFADLLTDRRGKRKGFPDTVLAELKLLQKLYTVQQTGKGMWELEATRRR